MSDQIDDLVRLIAERHGIAVSRDDPIFVLQTMNDRLMQDSLKAQQVQLAQYKEELEGLALRWSEDAKGKAERILNVALAGSKGAMSDLMDEGARRTADSARAEIDAALEILNTSIRDTLQIGILNVVAACITLLAAALAMWATLR
jgi:hypothetical protein